jgi:hydrogenase maturation protease
MNIQCLVIGVGNSYMEDDGIGIEIARELRKRDLGEGVLVLERQILDLSLLILSREASRLILVDALRSGRPPGTVTRFNATEQGSPMLQVPITHELRLYDLIEMARQSGILGCPITVVGVEPASCNLGRGLSRPVADALPVAVAEVVKELKRIGATK